MSVSRNRVARSATTSVMSNAQAVSSDFSRKPVVDTCTDFCYERFNTSSTRETSSHPLVTGVSGLNVADNSSSCDISSNNHNHHENSGSRISQNIAQSRRPTCFNVYKQSQLARSHWTSSSSSRSCNCQSFRFLLFIVVMLMTSCRLASARSMTSARHRHGHMRGQGHALQEEGQGNGVEEEDVQLPFDATVSFWK